MLLDMYRQVRNATQYSLDGLGYLMSSEFAARLEVYGFFWVFCLLIFLQAPISVLVTTFILFCVLIAVEALNTAIEVVVDRVSPEISEMAKRGKDLGSFSVMCLMAANGVNFIYALGQCDWSIASHTLSTTGGAILVSGLLLYIGIYSLAKKSPLKPFHIWMVLCLCILYFAGIGIHLAALLATGQGVSISALLALNTGMGGLGIVQYGQLGIGGIAYAFIAIVLLVFVHDLLGRQSFRSSQICLEFIKRRVTLAKVQACEGSVKPRAGHMIWQRYIGLPVLVLAVIINPLSQDLLQTLV